MISMEQSSFVLWVECDLAPLRNEDLGTKQRGGMTVVWTPSQICLVKSAQMPPPLSHFFPQPPSLGVGESLNSGPCSSDYWPWIQYFLALVSRIDFYKLYFYKPCHPHFTEEEAEARSWKGQVGIEGQRRGRTDLRSPIKFLLEIGWTVELPAVMELLHVCTVQYGSH